VSTVRQKVYRGELDFVRLGRSIRFEEVTLTRLIETSKTRGEAAKAAKVLAAEPAQ